MWRRDPTACSMRSSWGKGKVEVVREASPACELRRTFRGGGCEGGTPVLELRVTLGGKVNMAFAEKTHPEGRELNSR